MIELLVEKNKSIGAGNESNNFLNLSTGVSNADNIYLKVNPPSLRCFTSHLFPKQLLRFKRFTRDFTDSKESQKKTLRNSELKYITVITAKSWEHCPVK